MSIGQKNFNFDTMEIIIVSPDEGKFKLAMLIPDTRDYHKTGEIVAGGPAEGLKEEIKRFYKDLYGVTPIVTRYFYDDRQRKVDEDSDSIHSVSYIIEVPKPLTRPSVETIMVMRTSTTAKIEVIYPKDK